MTFYESEFVFEFDANWVVKKFDEQKVYRKLSGLGLKGVDFIGVNKSGALLLMEIKFYRQETPENKEIAEVFSKKTSDTAKAIQLIKSYLVGKWWFSLFRPFYLRFYHRLGDLAFWTKVIDSFDQEKPIFSILWLRALAPDPKLEHNVQKALDDLEPPEGFTFLHQEVIGTTGYFPKMKFRVEKRIK